jgi:hypothetical protein
LITYFLILIPLYIAASYDYDVWFGGAKENTDIWWHKIFRVLKSIADYPATIIVLSYLNWSIDLIGAYYVLKLAGGADAVYILKWKVYKREKYFVLYRVVTWLFWIFPIGWILTAVASVKNKSFTKCIMTRELFILNLIIGLTASYLTYHFKVVSLVWNFIYNYFTRGY